MGGTQSTIFTDDRLLQEIGNRMLSEKKDRTHNFPQRFVLSTDYDNFDFINLSYLIRFDNTTFEVKEIEELRSFEWGTDAIALLTCECFYECWQGAPADKRYVFNLETNTWTYGEGFYNQYAETFMYDIKNAEVVDEVFILAFGIEKTLGEVK
jgi:hypothetical protein